LARRTHTCLPPTAVGNNDLHQCKVKVAYPIIRLAHASLIELSKYQLKMKPIT
jgi:hypothetical protein